MKIDRAIMATDANPDYYKFWPTVAKRWISWGITPTLFVISKDKLNIDSSLGDVVYVNPTTDVPTAHQAQIIRLFAAASFRKDVCIISDIDMMPLQKEYFIESCKPYKDDKLVVYSSDAYLPDDPAHPAYPMCYLCSSGKTFYDIIGGDLDNFSKLVKEWISCGHGWHTDEKVFFQKLMDWQEQNAKTVFLRRGFNVSNHPITIARIDRSNGSDCRMDLLEKNYYVDYHMPRPYDKYSETIDTIYEKTKA